MKYYNEIFLNCGVVCSCDMLRLSFNMSDFYLKRFNVFINAYNLRYNNIKIKYYYSCATFQFRNLVTVTNLEDNTSFSIGLQFNDMGRTNGTCFIEFNPNKTMTNGLVLPFLEFIKKCVNTIDIVRYDIAFDIPIRREFLSLQKDFRKYSKIYSIDLRSKDMNDYTEYLGRRSNSGYVKLYNKQKESNLTYDCTRLELTLDKLDYDLLKKELPTLNLLKQSSLLDLVNLNDTERVLYTLILDNANGMQYFQNLGRKMQNKLKPLLIDSSFNFDITKSEFYKFCLIINEIIS